MKNSSASALLVIALFSSCASSGGDAINDDESSNVAESSSRNIPHEHCHDLGAPGSIVWGHALGPASFGIFDDVADGSRGVWVADQSASNVDDRGLSKLAANDGDTVYARRFGSVIASDREGNAYVAGTFSTPIQLGHHRLQPKVVLDVFVAKLSPDGAVEFARGLGVNGEGLHSIAVDDVGRIAISGAPMGTVLLSPVGSRERQLTFGGQVAFDSAGHLIVAGTFATIDLGDGVVTSTGQHDGFIAKVDAKGRVIWKAIVTSDDSFNVVAGVSVAVDRWDNIVLIGDFDHSIDLFGDTFDAIFAGESGRVQGVYVVKLDRHGKVIWKQGDFPAVDTSAVAIDARGDIFVSGDVRGNIPPFEITMLTKLDGAGEPVWTLESTLTSEYGQGHGVAVDSCGSAYWAVTARDSPSLLTPVRAWLLKVAP